MIAGHGRAREKHRAIRVKNIDAASAQLQILGDVQEQMATIAKAFDNLVDVSPDFIGNVFVVPQAVMRRTDCTNITTCRNDRRNKLRYFVSFHPAMVPNMPLR